MLHSAIEIARILDEAADRPPHTPTDEQRAVIEYAEARPRLVIAGAGSGKTTTLAEHLCWLVANEVVRPERILGLTFTRKAAAELQQKVRTSLAALHPGEVSDPIGQLMLSPEITTYNAYANRLFQDHALRIGREPDSALITEAAAWGLAAEVVGELGEQDPLVDQILELGLRPAGLIQHILRLDSLLQDNEVAPDELVDYAHHMEAQLETIPRKTTGSGDGMSTQVREVLTVVRSLPVLVPLCEEYERRKVERGLMEYGDQISGASRIMRSNPDVCAAERDRWDVVVLDEYQDTSVSQIQLLSTLFAGQRVLAVGDPNQSIYGWRGASAAGMQHFARDFSGGGPGARLSLSQSWRNDQGILDAANALIAKLPDEGVRTLTARPKVGPGDVHADFLRDLDAEAAACADWVAHRMVPNAEGKYPTAALLFRRKKDMNRFARALSERGIPTLIVGVGGALDSPEVTDLRCALAAMSDAGAGPELVRLLSGARWRLGPGTLVRLAGVARALAEHGYGTSPRTDAEAAAIRDGFRQGQSAGDAPSLVDALDAVSQPKSPYRVRFSDVEQKRLDAAGALLRRLRRRRRGSLTELVRTVIRELALDVELLANETHPHPGENLQVVLDKVSEYERAAVHPTVLGLLAWLDELQSREQLAPEGRDPEPGMVQLLTVHAAKGLEWDIVCVPELVVGDFPTKGRSSKGWLRMGELPTRFRKDADTLPQLPETGWEDQKTFRQLVNDYQEKNRDLHLQEESRLAYVAVTRARHSLLVTGARMGTGNTPRDPGPFLKACATVWKQTLPTFDATELSAQTPDVTPWPRDPLGSRRERVEKAASRVETSATPLPKQHPLRKLLAALQEEQQARAHDSGPELPDRIAASRFHQLLVEPEVALTDLRRPVPERPSGAGALGTAFHSWVQRRYEAEGWVESVDVPETADDTGRRRGPFDRTALQKLQNQFLASRWAGLRPVEVELSLEYPLGDVRIPCKLDAVFAVPGGFEVVDWKTGRPPASDEELRDRQYQLAIYRLAYAAYRGIDPAQVSARFFYVSAGREVAPARLSSQEELRAAWASLGSSPAAGDGVSDGDAS